MIRTAALGLVALNLAFLSNPASAACTFGTDEVTGMETIICETGGETSVWGTLIAEA